MLNFPDIQRKIPICAIAAAVLAVLSSAIITSAQVQNASRKVVVHVVNGKSGLPLSSVRIVAFGGESPKAVQSHTRQYEAITNKVGDADLTLDQSDEYIQVWVDNHTLCQDKPNFLSYSLNCIRNTGMSTPENCGKQTFKNVPGVLVVYARNRTFAEKLRQ